MLPPGESVVLSANPRFDALYQDLCNNKLNADGTSRLDAKAQRDRNGLSEELRKARVEAYKRELVRSGLQELSYRPNELPEELQELIAVVTTLLEQVSDEDRDLIQDDLSKLKEDIKPITAALLGLHRQDSDTLARMMDPDDPPQVEDLTARMHKLKTSIADIRSALDKSHLDLAQEASNLHGLYRQAIEASIRILEQTIHGSVARDTKAKVEYLSLVAEGMSKKLNIQQGQLMSQLYSTEVQDTLRRNHEDLERECRTEKRKVRESEDKLQEYKKAGGIESVAQEYADILKETEKVKADIARLKSGKE